ncbi:MAG: cell division protein ZapA [Desulfobacterales bacterium]
MEQLVTIELFGQQHTFKAESEVNRAKEVADLLTQEVSRIKSQQTGESSAASDFTTLMLAALNIAYQKLELENRYSKFAQDLSERSQRLIRQLDDYTL